MNPVEKYRRLVGTWLLGMCALVLIMIVVGGLTRLTESGLSMVEWRLFMGMIPPLSDADWSDVFEQYQQYPEYQQINVGMTIDEFKRIFWFEYIHRMLGRFIGLAFALPFSAFLAVKAIPRRLLPKLVVLFVLGGGQGLIGWWMVKSGLVDRPDVSHIRLTVHLGMAFLLYVALLWSGLTHLRANTIPISSRRRGLSRLATTAVGLVFLTVLSGGLVAGMNAGSQFNTFPLMNGQLIPDGLLVQQPLYLNFISNLMTIQFDHRLLGTTSATLITVLWAVGRRSVDGKARTALNAAFVMVLVQFSLGIATLLSVVWLPLASLHQTGAVILLTVLVWLSHELWRPQASQLDCEEADLRASN